MSQQYRAKISDGQFQVNIKIGNAWANAILTRCLKEKRTTTCLRGFSREPARNTGRSRASTKRHFTRHSVFFLMTRASTPVAANRGRMRIQWIVKIPIPDTPVFQTPLFENHVRFFTSDGPREET